MKKKQHPPQDFLQIFREWREILDSNFTAYSPAWSYPHKTTQFHSVELNVRSPHFKQAHPEISPITMSQIELVPTK